MRATQNDRQQWNGYHPPAGRGRLVQNTHPAGTPTEIPTAARYTTNLHFQYFSWVDTTYLFGAYFRLDPFILVTKTAMWAVMRSITKSLSSDSPLCRFSLPYKHLMLNRDYYNLRDLVSLSIIRDEVLLNTLNADLRNDLNTDDMSNWITTLMGAMTPVVLEFDNKLQLLTPSTAQETLHDILTQRGLHRRHIINAAEIDELLHPENPVVQQSRLSTVLGQPQRQDPPPFDPMVYFRRDP
jgi:hypothetical protein